MRYLITILVLLVCQPLDILAKDPLLKMQVGYSVGIQNVTEKKMVYAKSVGVDVIETSINAFIDKKKRAFTASDEEIKAQLMKAKGALDKAGVKVWSIHMPFGPHIDLSLLDERERNEVVALHRKVLEYVSILKPKIILFHPSYHLGLNEREQRIKQLVKSIEELNKDVKNIRATIVIENMLGYELVRSNKKQETPLCRTVDEMTAIMKLMPKDVFAAVDMNHIKHPENLIMALGKRLKSVHIADGDGKKECHYFPCSGEGENDWSAILLALKKVGYKGPFMYECAFKDVKDLRACFEGLVNNLKE